MKNILQNDEAPQDLALSEDREIPGEWLVEYFDDDGADTIFTGQEAGRGPACVGRMVHRRCPPTAVERPTRVLLSENGMTTL